MSHLVMTMLSGSDQFAFRAKPTCPLALLIQVMDSLNSGLLGDVAHPSFASCRFSIPSAIRIP